MQYPPVHLFVAMAFRDIAKHEVHQPEMSTRSCPNRRKDRALNAARYTPRSNSVVLLPVLCVFVASNTLEVVFGEVELLAAFMSRFSYVFR